MVSGDAILGATVTVGLAVAAGGWRLASLISRVVTRLDNQDEKVSAINAVVGTAPLLNGKGHELIHDVVVIRDDLRTHIVNSDTTHAALWSALTENKGL